MNKRKLNSYMKKELKRAKLNLAREKARCQRTYPDYLDNEFNMLDNLFIWGYNTNPKVEPSFLSWDDAYIYYNRATRLYYLVIDTGFYNEVKDNEAVQGELERLDRIEEAFRNFMIESNLSMNAEKVPFMDSGFEAETLTELYTKFRYTLEGYRQYRNLSVKSE